MEKKNIDEIMVNGYLKKHCLSKNMVLQNSLDNNPMFKHIYIIV